MLLHSMQIINTIFLNKKIVLMKFVKMFVHEIKLRHYFDMFVVTATFLMSPVLEKLIGKCGQLSESIRVITITKG